MPPAPTICRVMGILSRKAGRRSAIESMFGTESASFEVRGKKNVYLPYSNT